MPLGDVRAVHLPYCLERLEDGRYVILNREYKPIGFKTSSWIDYEKYPIAVKFKRLTAKTAEKISARASGNLKEIYLYNDGCVPTRSAKNMEAYLKRLEILAKLKLA